MTGYSCSKVHKRLILPGGDEIVYKRVVQYQGCKLCDLLNSRGYQTIKNIGLYKLTHTMWHAGEGSCGPCEMSAIAVEKFTLKDGTIRRE